MSQVSKNISFFSTRVDISGVIFIYTWDAFLGHPVFADEHLSFMNVFIREALTEKNTASEKFYNYASNRMRTCTDKCELQMILQEY